MPIFLDEKIIKSETTARQLTTPSVLRIVHTSRTTYTSKMKLSNNVILLLATGVVADAAFVSMGSGYTARSRVVTKGYLDDLTSELYAPEDNPDIENSTHEATNLSKDKVVNAGVGDWSGYVDFEEFDGGDGQMGVAGDGNKGLEKMGGGPSLYKSKSMSAKNAWGTETGYAKKLVEEGMDTARAQQLENWQNQQEIRKKQQADRQMQAAFETQQSTGEEDWRQLAKFGVERVQEFDMNEAFGEVAEGGDMMDTVEMHAALNAGDIHEFKLKNDFMGFADFRAAFTASSSPEFKVEPTEGSLKSREATDFIVRFRPQNPGLSEGTLIIETEDMKKMYRFLGNTA